MYDGNLGRAAAHINVGKVAFVGVGLFHQVVVEQLCFFLSLDDFEFDACLFLYFLEYFLAVLGVSHGRSGTGAEGFHIVEFHKLLEAFHHVKHHLFAFLGYLS